jgi:hypothetical protein
VNLIVALRNQRTALSLRPGVRAARLRYFAAAQASSDAYDKLAETKSPQARALLLSTLSACEWHTHDMHVAAWCPRTGADEEDQQTVGEHADAAELLHILASTEAAEGPAFRLPAPPEWEDLFGDVLNELSAEKNPARRAELMTRLYIRAQPVLGQIPGETINTLRTAYIRLALAAHNPAKEMTA